MRQRSCDMHQVTRKSETERAAISDPRDIAHRRGKTVSLRTLLVAVVALALLFAATFLPSRDILTALQATDPAMLVLALALHLAVFPFWVWQWHLMAAAFAPVQRRGIMAAVALSIGAKVSVSGLAGVSAGVLALKSHGGLSYSEAGSVMSFDQFLALATKLMVLMLALMLAPLPAAIHHGAVTLLGLAVMMVVALLYARRLELILGALAPTGAGVLSRLAAALATFLQDVARIGTARVILGGLALAVLKRALEIGAALAVLNACGIMADPVAALLVVAAVSVTTLVPVMPANLGTHSAGVFAGLILIGVPQELALAAGLLHHAVVLASSAIVAVAGLGVTASLKRIPFR